MSATLLRSGRSITAIQRATGGDLIWDPSGKYLRCKVCAPSGGKKSHHGIFAYDVACGTSFETEQKLPQRFRSLKVRVGELFRSEAHKEAKKTRPEGAKQKAHVVADASA